MQQQHSPGRIILYLLSIPKTRILYKIFLAFILATSIPAGIMISISFLNTSSLVRTDFLNYKESLNVQVYKNIDENLSTMQLQTQSLSYNISDIRKFLNYRNDTIDENYITTSDSVTYYLTSILSINNHFDGVGLIDNDGFWTKFVNTAGLIPTGSSFKDRDWVRKTVANRGDPLLFIMDLTEYTTSTRLKSSVGTSVIAVTRTLYDYNDSFNPIGISIFTQNLANFGSMVTANCISPGETMVILDQHNELIYSNKDPQSFTKDLIPGILSSAGSKPKQFHSDIDGYLVIYNASSKFGFKVLSLIPQSMIASKLSPVKNINIALVCSLILLAVLISILLSRLITHPLKRLMKSFNRLETGDFDTTVSVRGQDEFAQICRSFNGMVLNIKSLIRQKYELDIYRKQSDIEALQSKINPHFLYNTLSSIKAVIEKKDFAGATHMVQDLSDIFRYSLNRGKFVVTLADELDHVRQYISLQKLRFGDRFEPRYDIDDNLMQCSLLRLSIQPLVENAILHGFENTRQNGIINISVNSFRDCLYIYVADNGAGIPPDKLAEMNALLELSPDAELDSPSRKMVGIYNVNSRIKLYFGNEYGIRVSSSEGQGSTVRITLPMNP